MLRHTFVTTNYILAAYMASRRGLFLNVLAERAVVAQRVTCERRR